MAKDIIEFFIKGKTRVAVIGTLLGAILGIGYLQCKVLEQDRRITALEQDNKNTIVVLTRVDEKTGNFASQFKEFVTDVKQYMRAHK